MNKIYTYCFDFKTYNAKTGTGVIDKLDVEIDENWYEVLTDSDKTLKNHNRSETRRHSGYDKLEWFNNHVNTCWGNNNPEITLIKKEFHLAKDKAFFDLYDKILRSLKFLTQKQLMAFEFRALCDMPFKEIAYHMKYSCQMNENEQSAKKHFYNAIKKIKKHFMKDYNNMKKTLANF